MKQNSESSKTINGKKRQRSCETEAHRAKMRSERKKNGQ
jgi:hypothetical protein